MEEEEYEKYFSTYTATLTYTEDFIIYCAVFRLLPEDVLANFMRLLMVDSYNLGTKDDTTPTANNAFTDYFKEKEKLQDAGDINFTCNFVVLCFLHGINPGALRQNFINHISLAKDFARNGSEESLNDPWMDFMEEMSDEYFQDNDELHQIGFFDQHREMDLLHRDSSRQDAL